MGANADALVEVDGKSILILSQQREMFATLVACGAGYRDAAVRCGFAADYGWDLAQRPEIKARIVELADEPREAIKQSIRVELQVLRNRAALHGGEESVRAEIECRLRVIMAQAKLEGFVVERKQVSKLTASVKMSRNDVDAILQADLERLAPGATGQLTRLGRDPDRSDLARIAAGEDDGTTDTQRLR